MKKILLAFFCLLIVSICAGSAFASGDADNNVNDTYDSYEDFVPFVSVPVNVTDFNCSEVVDDSYDSYEDFVPFVSVPVNVTDFNCSVIVDGNAYAEPDSNQSIQNNDTTTNDKNASKLNITGPKHDNHLDIKGPKGNPQIDLSQMDKDIFHFAKVFMDNPIWDLYDCIDYVRFHSNYNWHETSIIVARAHNIALHKYHGEEIMVLGWDITPESVELRSKNFYGWK